MVNNQKVLGLIGLCMRAGELTFGTELCIDLIEKHKIKLILVANDAADRTKRNFEYICNKNNTKIVLFGTIDELSKSIGKKNKAVFGIKNENFANQIYQVINGGDIIG